VNKNYVCRKFVSKSLASGFQAATRALSVWTVQSVQGADLRYCPSTCHINSTTNADPKQKFRIQIRNWPKFLFLRKFLRSLIFKHKCFTLAQFRDLATIKCATVFVGSWDKDENSRIRIRIRINWSEARIHGSGSVTKWHWSITLRTTTCKCKICTV
jgi:hypothetical protein